MFATPRPSVTLGVLNISDLFTGQSSNNGVRAELEKLAARSTNTPYENTLRKLFEEKLKEDERGISKNNATEHAVSSPSSSPSKKQEILNIVRSSVNQNGSRARATSSSSPSSAAGQSAKVAQLSQPLERNKWTGSSLPNPNSAFAFERSTTNHLGRQRPAADAPAPVFRARSPSPRADRSSSCATATDLSLDAVSASASTSTRRTVRLSDFRQWVRKGERWQEDRQRRIDSLKATLEEEKKRAAATAPPPSSLSTSSSVVISPSSRPRASSSSSARRRSSSRGSRGGGSGSSRGMGEGEEEEDESLLGESLLLDSAVSAGALSLDAMVKRLAAGGLSAPSEPADNEPVSRSSASSSASRAAAGEGGAGPVRSLFPRRHVRSLSPSASASASEAGAAKAQSARAKAALEREREQARLFSPRIDPLSRELAEAARARHDAALLLLASQGQARGRSSSSASAYTCTSSSASEGRGRPTRRVPSKERLGFGSSSPRRAAVAPLIQSRSGALLSQVSFLHKDLLTVAGGRGDLNNNINKNNAEARGLPSPGSPWYSRPRSASPASSRAASASGSGADARARSSSATPRPKTAPPPPAVRLSSGSAPVFVHTSFGSELIMANKASTLDDRLKESVEMFLVKREVADRMARAGAASPAPGQYSLKSEFDVAARAGGARSRSSSPDGGGAKWAKASRNLVFAAAPDPGAGTVGAALSLA